MEEDRSLELYRSFVSMDVGLDRLMLGISLAICGYLGQTVEFGKIGMNVPTGNLVVMLLFVFSAAFGVMRLERTRDLTKHNYQMLEGRRQLKTGPTMPELAALQQNVCLEVEYFKRARKEGAFAYSARNWSMLIGLLSYVALKVAAAY